MQPSPASQNIAEQAPESPASTSDALDDLEFASDSGFVGVIEDQDSDRVEDCVEPG